MPSMRVLFWIHSKTKEQRKEGHLETHHIDNDPANNDRLNLLVVCIACHKLIHWARTYIRNHMTDGE